MTTKSAKRTATPDNIISKKYKHLRTRVEGVKLLLLKINIIRM